MNTTDKILLAHYFPNTVLFKIYNRINLNFGVTIVALDLKLLRKIKCRCQLAEKKKISLDIFWADGYYAKTKKDKKS